MKEEDMGLDQEKLDAFVGRFVGDLGATITAGGVVVGHRLGLYRALAEAGGTPHDPAPRTPCDPRDVPPWVRRPAARGHLPHDPGTGLFSLREGAGLLLAG